MSDNRFIGQSFAGLETAEKQQLDTLWEAFQSKQADFKTASDAFQAYVKTLQEKYQLLSHTPIATGDLDALRAAEVTSESNRQAEITAQLSTATNEEKAKYDAWVKAGRPVQTLENLMKRVPA